MKTTLHYLTLCLFISMLSMAHAEKVNGKSRTWTRVDGKTATGKLVSIDADTITLKIGNRVNQFPLARFSKEDRDYVASMKPKPLAGKLVAYPITGATKEQQAYLNEHNVQSLHWKNEVKKKGKVVTEQLPFLLHTPDSTKTRRPVPIIVHLCGTGGIGKGNLKPLFNDAGGTAKNFLSDSLQKFRPCYVMIPQPTHAGAWFSGHFTDPSVELERVVFALKHLLKSKAYNIDPDRIYITGLSMGGAGVYQAMAKYPEIFAAGIPVSYVETVEIFNKDNAGPLWIVVNKGDKGQSMEMLKEFRTVYKKLRGDLRVSVYDTGGHNAWSKMLGDQKFKTWLFNKKL